MLHAQQVKAQMDAELQRMEEELEEQLRKEREEYDLKRLEISTRAAARRQQMGQDSLDIPLDRRNTPSRREQTPEVQDLFEEHEQNKRLHAMAVSQQERAQREELEKRLRARKSTKSKEFVKKFKKDVLENGMPASCSDLRGMDLSAEERAQVLLAMTLSHWLGSRIADPVLSKMEPVMKMANKWISKVLGRELQEVQLRRKQREEQSAHKPEGYASAMQSTNPSHTALVARTRRMQQPEITGGVQEYKDQLNKMMRIANLWRGNSAQRCFETWQQCTFGFTFAPETRSHSHVGAGSGLQGNHDADSTLKLELEEARRDVAAEAARAKEVEKQVDVLQQQIAQMRSAPVSGEGGEGGDAAGRKELVKMLESSPLAAKLSQVETLLLTLVTQKKSR